MDTDSMDDQMTFDRARELSILKWETIVEADGRMVEMPDEVIGLIGHCGFCQRWRALEPYKFKSCAMCELAKLAGECTDDNSLFSIWANKPTKENAISILLAVRATTETKTIIN